MKDEKIMKCIDPEKRFAVKNAYFENGNCIIELDEGLGFAGCDKDDNDMFGKEKKCGVPIINFMKLSLLCVIR